MSDPSTNGSAQSNGLASRISAWASAPFTESMDIWHWIFFAIIIASAVVLWIGVLRAIKIESLIE
jgi:hypothetical protein